MPSCIKPTLISLALLCLFLAGCGKPTGKNLSLVFTGDFGGRIEPCGCFENQLGGLTRLGGWIQTHHTDSALKIDLGDALRGQNEDDLEQYPYMLKAYHHLGYQAIQLGSEEFKCDVEQLKAYINQAPLPLLNANVLDEQGQNIAQPYLLTKKNGLELAILSVADEKDLKPLGKGLKVRPMKETLNEYLKVLRPKVDLLILCTTASLEKAQELQDYYAEIDLILTSGVSQPTQDLIQKRKTFLAGISGDGKNVGYTEFTVTDKSISKVHQYDVQLLKSHYPRLKKLLSLQTDYREHIGKLTLSIDEAKATINNIPGVQQESQFVGSQTCMSCHSQSYAVWQTSAHARAYDSLKHEGAHMDPQCLKCHSVGLGQKSGFNRKAPQAHLSGVGCESCHGPGSAHVQSRLTGKKNFYRMRPLAESDCKRCHQGEFSRPFHWHQWWPIIAHGVEQK